MGNDLSSSEFEHFLSHPGKSLERHTSGVVKIAEELGASRVGVISARSHDTGKINPNFQAKLGPRGRTKAITNAYSNHAYLSMVALVDVLLNRGGDEAALKLSQLEELRLYMLVARHHGDLPNLTPLTYNGAKQVKLRSAIDAAEFERACDFYFGCSKIGQDNDMFRRFTCMQLGLDTISAERAAKRDAILKTYKRESSLRVGSALEFVIQSQFDFACLVQADKRDASDYEKCVRSVTSLFPEGISQHESAPANVADDATLNDVRSYIRDTALSNLETLLAQRPSQRVFCLTAPTGAGKTLTLLALAKKLLAGGTYGRRTPAGVIYALPFLSITEQVDSVCRAAVSEPDTVLRADSGAQNMRLDDLIALAEQGDDNAAQNVAAEMFRELIFDAPFVVTTFVQLFETLMSNKNSTLLKLPSFAGRVIVIDEIQALPPRLYVFFAAWLVEFCSRFDAYVILSTATMPAFGLPDSKNEQLEAVFCRYRGLEPVQILEEDIFLNPRFNRYRIEPRWEICSVAALSDEVNRVLLDGESVMVILNTIADTRDLYKRFAGREDVEVLLLNTRFTPLDRREKIEQCRDTNPAKPVLLITTQMVEAGVDISFQVVFRDLCPLPSLIQAAGRCNRHGATQMGRIFLIDIKDERGSRADRIYARDTGRWYLQFAKDNILAPLTEIELFELQKRFFKEINKNLRVGQLTGSASRVKDNEENLVDYISKAAFADLGGFRLIEKEREQYAVYVPCSNAGSDDLFAGLEALTANFKEARASGEIRRVQFVRAQIESMLSSMRDRTVQARIKPDLLRRLCPREPILGLYRLTNPNNYSTTYGLEIAGDDNII